ncbi:type VI secretion system-associated protein TagO [Alteromonas lipolytica]|uniref:Uncharacterized protein n=1 Tax=Alteromonas lipolytica TaxID=1856405 RepID=A0A1E8FF28_9ALTE|nr:type VI secretion system-associated protein TagO [Alteromonas lipolytica]OFI34208.1 hypothetical protein BFC17_21980 [Alteromonas lipolytica]GGF84119.1 hypothetical protein GCM10011338_40510 [Alteromonas lipolytica]
MLKFAVLMALAFLFTGSVNAVDNKEFAICAKKTGDLSRLECYDNLADKDNLKGNQQQPLNMKSKGKWQVSITKNPVDDSKSVTFSTVLTHTPSDSLGF